MNIFSICRHRYHHHDVKSSTFYLRTYKLEVTFSRRRHPLRSLAVKCRVVSCIHTHTHRMNDDDLNAFLLLRLLGRLAKPYEMTGTNGHKHQEDGLLVSPDLFILSTKCVCKIKIAKRGKETFPQWAFLEVPTKKLAEANL